MITKNELKRVLLKTMALTIVFLMTFGNVAFVGTELFTVYALSIDELDKQNSKTQNSNVEFDAFFKQGETDTHKGVLNTKNEDNILYINLNIRNAGYFKDAKIHFKDENNIDNTNFEIIEFVDSNQIIGKTNNNNKEIVLNQINSNTYNTLCTKLKLSIDEISDVSKLNKNNKVVLTGIYVNEKGKEINIEKEIIINIKWESGNNILIGSEISKYIQFNMNENKGVMLETTITVEQEEKNENSIMNTLPIRRTSLNVKVPNLNEIAPTYVKVVSTDTSATNGKTEELVNINWNYDEENKCVIINTENKIDESGKIWTGAGQDKYKVIFVYPEEAYNSNEQTNVTIDAKATIDLYKDANEVIEVEKELLEEKELKDNIGDILSYEVKSAQNKLSKGNIYSNYMSELTKNETEYDEQWLVNIGYAQLINEIILEGKADVFSNEKKEYSSIVKNENMTYLKQTKINKNIFTNILGTEGKIEILKPDGEKITEIDNNTQVNEQNEIIIDYSNLNKAVSSVIIKTSKPITEGLLKVEHIKAIKSDPIYNLSTVKEFKNLNMGMVTKIKLANSEENEQISATKTANIILEETTTNATLYMNKTTLSTLVKNESVEFKIELNNNLENSDLYKNPVFDIIFPSYVEDVNIKDINILFDEELKIKNTEKFVENEHIVVRITLDGKQTKFNTVEMANGTNIALNTDIITKLLTPSIEENITLRYSNENAISYTNPVDGIGQHQIKVNFAAPTGLLSITEMSDFDSTGRRITSVNQGEVIEKIQILEPTKIGTATLRIINNNQNKCNEIISIGRIPFKDNKSILTGENLGTTVNTILKTEITVEGINENNVTIYYSENGEADTDLVNPSNEWTTSPSDISKVKSFLMVTNGYEMEQYSTITLKYQFEIPANIEHNNSIFGDFVTYYKNENSTNTEISKSDKVGLTTGEGPQLNVETMISVGNEQTVTEGQRIKYFVKVKNTGNNIAEDVIVKAKVPEGTTYTEYIMGKGEDSFSGYVKKATTKEIAFNAGTLQPQEEKIAQYEVEVDVKEGENLPINNSSIVVAKDLSKEIVSNTVRNEVQEAKVIIEMYSSIPQEEKLREGMEILYNIIIRNVSGNDLNNVEIKDVLPEGIVYSDAFKVVYNDTLKDFDYVRDNVTYNSENRLLTWKFDSIAKDKVAQVKLIVKADTLKQNEYDKQVINKVVVTADGISSVQSGDIENNISRAKLVIGQTCSKEGQYLAAGEEFEYYITAKNEGNLSTGNIRVQDTLPEQLTVIGLKYKLDEKETTISAPADGKIDLNVSINPSQTLVVIIKVRAADNLTQDTIVKNSAKIILGNSSEMTTEEIAHTIEKAEARPSDERPTDNPTVDPNVKKYKITGTAWLDENGNGTREVSEQLLDNVTVKLISTNNNNIVAEIKTNKEGRYSFENLDKGNYFIVFDYDTNIYELTEYQKDGVNSELNSDAIGTNITQDGVTRKSAVTNTIKIEQVSISGIDIGLTTSPKFDLKLDKYVSKIIIQNSQGTKTYEYDNAKLAKADINGKYLAGSLVIVEYKLVITNEGTIGGYAKNLVDYIPTGMKFSSELNGNWYTGTGGSLYNTDLKDELINPGQSREVVLILTKNMTESNTGITNNIAEIAETYNKMGLKDTNSTPGNKIQGENDMSTADFLISVKTGTVAMYTILILTILAVIGAGVYIINKKVLRKI